MAKMKRHPSMVGRMAPAHQDVQPLATKYSCAHHQITYYVVEAQPTTCPQCVLEERLGEALRENTALKNLLSRTDAEMSRLQVRVDLSAAMVACVDTLNTADKLWLKEHLYEFKLSNSVVLKAMRDRRGHVNGFIAIRRKGEPEARVCTSVGGIALANYYDEANTTMGTAQAMKLVVNSLWEFLPGAKP